MLFNVWKMDYGQESELRTQSSAVWTSEMSTCALRYLAQLVADGNRVDKGFKSSHYNQCAKLVNERFHVNFSGSQIPNHLKTWKTHWNTFTTLKKLSSTHFNEETGTILLDEKNYLARVQNKASEAKYLNKPIENYHYMAIIFGNHQATGLFAKGINDPLASDPSEETYSVGSEDFGGHESNNSSPARDVGGSSTQGGGESSARGSSGRKRGRVMLDDDDLGLRGVTEAFKGLSDAIRESAPPPPPPPPTIPPNLWPVIQQIPTFERAHLALYFQHLCLNIPLAHAFLGLDHPDQMVWVASFIHKNLSG